jgi:hypothetical protein
MTLEQLAEITKQESEHFAALTFDPNWMTYHDYGVGCKNAFLEGAKLALEFGQWVGEKNIVWTGIHWWDEKNDCHFCGEYNEAFEIFLSGKYEID